MSEATAGEAAPSGEGHWERAKPRAKRDVSVRGFIGWRWAPHTVLGLVVAIVGVYVARLGLRIDTFALDETVIKQSAVHYTHGLPNSLIHDPNARASSRLYSLVLSVIFRIWSGSDAVRYAKVLNVVIFMSAVVPVWLLAREFLSSRWRVAAAAGLSVIAPWLAITTVLFTECLAYPLFAWALVAMVWAIRAPSWRRDLVAMIAIGALIGTRVQFASIFAVWIGIIVVVEWLAAKAGDSADGHWARARRAAKSAIAGHPFSLAVVALGGLYALRLLLNGSLHAKLQSSLGTYSELQDRPGVTPDYLPSLMVEVVNFSVGTGILPAVAAFAFWAAALGRRADPRQWNTTFVVVATAVGTTLVTLYVQGGYLGQFTEERYYMYLLPLVWIGALAALQAPRVPRTWLAVSGGAVVLLAATMPLLVGPSGEYTYLSPAATVVGHWAQRLNVHLIAGLTERDAVALAALAAVAIGVVAWRKRWARVTVWFVAPAIVQLLVMAYAFAVIDGKVASIPGRVLGQDFATLAFVDGHVPHGTDVTWLDAQRKPADNSAIAVQQIALFWNQDITGVGYDTTLGLPPVSYELNTTNLQPLSVDPSTGIVTSTLPMKRMVVPAGSPFLQIGAVKVIAQSPLGMALIQPGDPVAATWQALGLAPDGTVPAAPPARLRIWGVGETSTRMSFVASGATPATIVVTFSGRTHQIAVPGGATGATVTIDAGCAALGHPVTGTVRATAGSAQLVAVTPAVTGAC